PVTPSSVTRSISKRGTVLTIAALVPSVKLSGTSTPREVRERSLSCCLPASVKAIVYIHQVVVRGEYPNSGQFDVRSSGSVEHIRYLTAVFSLVDVWHHPSRCCLVGLARSVGCKVDRKCQNHRCGADQEQQPVISGAVREDE